MFSTQRKDSGRLKMALSTQDVEARQQALEAHIDSLIKLKDRLYFLAQARLGFISNLKYQRQRLSRLPNTAGLTPTANVHDSQMRAQCESEIERIESELSLNEQEIETLCEGKGF